jgi:hypothetical protein
VAKLHGKNGAIWIDGVKVTNKTEWSLSMNREYADVTTFRDGNKVYAVGLMDITGSFSGLYDTDGEALTFYNDGNSHLVQLYADDQVTLVAEGEAYIDASVTASLSDAVRCSGSLRSAGGWLVY